MDNLTTAIKSKENFNDYQIALIQTAALIGFYMTFFSGLMYDRLGAVLTISFGAILVLLGYSTMFIASFFDSNGFFQIFKHRLHQHPLYTSNIGEMKVDQRNIYLIDYGNKRI